MEQIVIDKEAFKKLKPVLKPHLKDNCDFCGVKVTGDNFGLLAKDYTVCQSLICLTEYFEKVDAKDNPHEKEGCGKGFNTVGDIWCGDGINLCHKCKDAETNKEVKKK